ncbi:MAG: hypothetical protein SP4CHLAM17_12560 [Chlamydiales bacterium]|nr:hypothetical protein [Chlamydiales bacterium]
MLAAVAACIVSTVGFADGEKCSPGKGCSGMKGEQPTMMESKDQMNGEKPAMMESKDQMSGKGGGSVMNGDKPIVMEPNDHIKGSVKSVESVKYPNGSKTHMVVNTDQGEKKVVLTGKEVENMRFQSGDKVELHGRRMYANGKEVMVCDKCKKTNSSTLNSHVKSE